MPDSDGAERDADPLLGAVVADRYQVVERLGAGAMGRVYRARHVLMQKDVALKVLHPETSESAEIVTRFEREAVVAGKINHPNVASATDFGRLADGSFYLVLEYVSGRSLSALLEEVGALPVDRALGITAQILAALSAAHHAGIVHRDLKPDNVMLVALDQVPTSSLAVRASSAGVDVVKVLDFGLAKLQKADTKATQLTVAGAIYGTPQYMAPEQASGAEVDERADLYAAGVVLYEMLCGQPPFQAEQMMPLLLQHMTAEPPPLPEAVPREVRRIVLRLLAKKPEDRYASADEVLALLLPTLESGRVKHESSSRFQSSGLPDLTTMKKQALDRGARTWAVARPALRSLSRELSRQLAREFELRGRRVPAWFVLVAGLGVTLGILLAVALSRAGASDTVSTRAEADEVEVPSSAPSKVIDAELQKILDAARSGSDSALYALQHRGDALRSDVEWLALGQAYLMRRDVGAALRSLGRAASESSPLVVSRDKAITGALRYLADDEQWAEPILRFVVERLPDFAPDFLFDVWSKTAAKTRATEVAKELLDSPAVKKHYGPALELALAIRRADDCSQQIALLPKIISRGDERTLSRLREMKRDGKCAKTAGRSLDEALTQAALRKAPRFPLLRRWRFKVPREGSSEGTSGG